MKIKNLYLIFLSFLFIGCSPALFKTKWTKEIAPETYVARFQTTKGNFDIRITRKLSPKAADRFFQLVKYEYFDNGIFYRVNPGFVAQFGNSDSTNQTNWNRKSINIPDEKVIQGNQRGTLSFARGGIESRTTDLFINLGNNSRLDTIAYNGVKGFPAFGEVINGIGVVDSLYNGYSDTTMGTLDLMYENRPKFLKKFPKLDLIKKVYIVKP